IPMFWEWSALIIALFYFIVRYTKNIKKVKIQQSYFYQNLNLILFVCFL
ncbi:sulfite oxidase heme-binding subunit YedZ, partial [Campylobacter jejuni]|nr:sulfite oxidase heme-binding subunit YedZ [Campylobacter jejuni]